MPTATLNQVSKRSSRGAIDGLYSLVSDQARVQLTSWKRRCNEMAKSCTLQDHLDTISNIEQVVACKPSRDYLIPARLADSDIMSSAFWTQYGLTKPQKKPQAEKNNGKPGWSKSGTPQTSGPSTRSSSWESARGPSAGRRSWASTPGSNLSLESGRSKTISGLKRSSRDDRRRGQRYRAEEEEKKGRGGRDERNKGSGRKKEKEDAKMANVSTTMILVKVVKPWIKVVKNVVPFHIFIKIACVTRFSMISPAGTAARRVQLCTIPPDLCRFSQSRYKTPPQRSSPVSFQGNDNLSNIFTKKW